MQYGVPAQATWGTSDGSAWWLRDTTYSQPSGDYAANCYLNLFGTPENENSIVFDDDSCNVHSRSYYCQSLRTTTTTTVTIAAIPPPQVDDATSEWESEGRQVYLFKTSKCVDMRTQADFCEDKNLLWFSPKSAADGSLLVANSLAVDNYHTWSMLKNVPAEFTVKAGSSLNTDVVMGSNDKEWSAIRGWSSTSCVPESYSYASCCWDTGHEYDWLACEEGPDAVTAAPVVEEPVEEAEAESSLVISFHSVGVGFCADVLGDKTPNLSADDVTIENCELYCTDKTDCLGYSHTEENSRCALWVSQHHEGGETIDGVAFEGVNSETSEDGEVTTWMSVGPVTKANGVEGSECFAKVVSQPEEASAITSYEGDFTPPWNDDPDTITDWEAWCLHEQEEGCTVCGAGDVRDTYCIPMCEAMGCEEAELLKLSGPQKAKKHHPKIYKRAKKMTKIHQAKKIHHRK